MTLIDLPVFSLAEVANAETLITLALAEDLGDKGDITSQATIPEAAIGQARFVARETGVLAGLPVVDRIMTRFDLSGGWRPHLVDGGTLAKGSVIGVVVGSMRSILAMERTALNFLQRLSGIATLTAKFVASVAESRTFILDTRKTTPGWRSLEKYAVRCGGGQNHRMGLYDAVLIKDNHLAWLESEADPFVVAIDRARKHASNAAFVEVEVDSLDQFDRALSCRPDIILLDNFSVADLVEAVRRRDAMKSGVLLEASGGVRLETVAAIARTDIDRISVGALTHSAPALDIGLDFGEET